MTAFPHLLAPGRIGPLELRNRIVLAPMGSYLGGEDGHITERHTRFYEERARGGAGLVTTEVVAVDWPRGAKVVTLVSGGNIDWERMCAAFAAYREAEGE